MKLGVLERVDKIAQSQKVSAAARRAAMAILSVPGEPSALPDGGIAIEWCAGGVRARVEIGPDGRVKGAGDGD